MLRWNEDIMVFCRLVYQKFSCLILRNLKLKERQVFLEIINPLMPGGNKKVTHT